MRLIPLRALMAGTLLTASSLACSVGLGGPKPPASPIAISTEAAGQLEDIITQAVGSANNGAVTVVVTEEQLTSYFALKLAENPDTPFEDIQILLRDGQVIMHANATLQNITAPAEIRLDITTNPEGGLDVHVADADFGPMPVPQSMLDALSTGLDEALSGEFGPQATGFKMTNVVVGDGQMTITGSVNP